MSERVGVTSSVLPDHIGLILDGNRRWGRLHGRVDGISGTAEGVENTNRIVESIVDKGIRHITVFAFSAENWRRKPEEVDYLMKLFRGVVAKFSKRAKEHDIQIRFVGRISDFPSDVQKEISKAVENTQGCTRAILNVAASYGGHTEIVDATREIIAADLKPEEVTEEVFAKYIYEKDQPDLDLVVRTGGVKRTSGFMLWQASYAEMYFTDVLWPDFDDVELDKALQFFVDTKRNFGS